MGGASAKSIERGFTKREGASDYIASAVSKAESNAIEPGPRAETRPKRLPPVAIDRTPPRRPRSSRIGIHSRSRGGHRSGIRGAARGHRHVRRRGVRRDAGRRGRHESNRPAAQANGPPPLERRTSRMAKRKTRHLRHALARRRRPHEWQGCAILAGHRLRRIVRPCSWRWEQEPRERWSAPAPVGERDVPTRPTRARIRRPPSPKRREIRRMTAALPKGSPWLDR